MPSRTSDLSPPPPVAERPWWADETVIRLSALPAKLPRLPNGKRVSIASAYRFTTRGVRGMRIRRFRGLGSAWCTTLEEVARWQHELTRQDGGDA